MPYMWERWERCNHSNNFSISKNLFNKINNWSDGKFPGKMKQNSKIALTDCWTYPPSLQFPFLNSFYELVPYQIRNGLVYNVLHELHLPVLQSVHDHDLLLGYPLPGNTLAMSVTLSLHYSLPCTIVAMAQEIFEILQNIWGIVETNEGSQKYCDAGRGHCKIADTSYYTHKYWCDTSCFI